MKQITDENEAIDNHNLAQIFEPMAYKLQEMIDQNTSSTFQVEAEYILEKIKEILKKYTGLEYDQELLNEHPEFME